MPRSPAQRTAGALLPIDTASSSRWVSSSEQKKKDCPYGTATLSVDAGDYFGDGRNCPSGAGSVTFGKYNSAGGDGATVTGGQSNAANEDASTVAGGNTNSANYWYSSVFGGNHNSANGVSSSVSGGEFNTADADKSSVYGGYVNRAEGKYSSAVGGKENVAAEEYSVVVGELETSCRDDNKFKDGKRTCAEVRKKNPDKILKFCNKKYLYNGKKIYLRDICVSTCGNC